MKSLIILFAIILLPVISGCDRIGRSDFDPGTPRPIINVLELNVPNDASLTADIKFQVTSGIPPFVIFPTNAEIIIVDEAQAIYQIVDIKPSLRRYVITATDSNFKTDTTSLYFPIPEITAEGLYKNAGGTIETVDYSFRNYGSESKPNYFLTENVYSNVYSFGSNNEEVVGTITSSGGYEGQKEYSRYQFPQAFGLAADEYDQSTDAFYHPINGNKYTFVYQGICPKYWHIPNNDEWLKLLSDIGITVGSSPNASLTGGVFGYRYMHSADEKELFETEFNTGYSYADGTYPTGGLPGVGYWTSSLTGDDSQYVMYLRFTEGNMSLEAWGQNSGRGWYWEHVRCKFDF